MQYVNDDMDELFRRAAENYPLDTNSADWNKVLAALQGETQVKADSKGRRNNRLLWLLLLLPVGFVCNQMYSPGPSNSDLITGTGTEQQNVQIDGKGTGSQTETGPKAADPVQNNPLRKDESSTPKNDFQASSLNNAASFYPARLTDRARPAGVTALNADIPSREDQSGLNESSLDEQALSFSRTYLPSVDRDLTRNMGELPLTQVSPRLNPAVDPSESMTKPGIPRLRSKKWYVGLMWGIDATTIKFQKVENRGHSYGVLVGYSLNERWSVETGSYIENKYYYSDGKYFNTSKITMPPNARIDEVSGDCNMIEVPVSVKYNFGMTNKSNWFATAGASTYFMNKEDYKYNYYYGAVGPVARYKEYKNSSTNLFSAISLSAGYTHKIARFADLRIEPYLKIPLKGMGVGSLPLFSTGIQVGIAKRF